MARRRLAWWLGLVLALAPLLAVADDPRASGGSVVDARASLDPALRHTLELIDRGGPYPYERDGIEFRNREGVLPKKPRGYYHEYTVPTPGERTRGARRVVTGAGGERYFSDDHYRTFRLIERRP